MLRIGFVVYPNCQTLGLTVMTAFECANAVGSKPHYRCEAVSAAGGVIRTSLGLSVASRAMARETFDTLIILGGNDGAPPTAGLIEQIQEAAKRARRVASFCTGAFLLAEAGCLAGKCATTHLQFSGELQKRHQSIRIDADRFFVIDGNAATAGGLSCGFDLALAMIEDDLGRDIAQRVAKRLVLRPRRGGGQSQFDALPALPDKPNAVGKVIDFVKKNLTRDLPVPVLAEIANVSPRHFSRMMREAMGHSPAKVVERLRVEAARSLLETSGLSLTVVAQKSGLGDVERLRRAFRRTFGIPPQAVRRATL